MLISIFQHRLWHILWSGSADQKRISTKRVPFRQIRSAAKVSRSSHRRQCWVEVVDVGANIALPGGCSAGTVGQREFPTKPKPYY